MFLFACRLVQPWFAWQRLQMFRSDRQQFIEQRRGRATPQPVRAVVARHTVPQFLLQMLRNVRRSYHHEFPPPIDQWLASACNTAAQSLPQTTIIRWMDGAWHIHVPTAAPTRPPTMAAFVSVSPPPAMVSRIASTYLSHTQNTYSVRCESRSSV